MGQITRQDLALSIHVMLAATGLRSSCGWQRRSSFSLKTLG
jgi:hypothetical protein